MARAACPLYIAHVRETHKKLADSTQGSENACDLNQIEVKQLNSALTIFSGIHNQIDASQINRAFDDVNALPYAENLSKMHKARLLFLAEKESRTAEETSDMNMRFQNMRDVLCNNFRKWITTTKHCEHTRELEEMDTTQLTINQLCHAGINTVIHFMFDENSEPSHTDTKQNLHNFLTKNALDILNKNWKNLLHSFGDPDWTGLELLQHALYLEDRHYTDVLKYGTVTVPSGEAAHHGGVYKLNNLQEVRRFLWAIANLLSSSGKYFYSIPSRGTPTGD